jgi:hypothetical protein
MFTVLETQLTHRESEEGRKGRRGKYEKRWPIFSSSSLKLNDHVN